MPRFGSASTVIERLVKIVAHVVMGDGSECGTRIGECETRRGTQAIYQILAPRLWAEALVLPELVSRSASTGK